MDQGSVWGRTSIASIDCVTSSSFVEFSLEKATSVMPAAAIRLPVTSEASAMTGKGQHRSRLSLRQRMAVHSA
jgi:hypothetical protein